MSAAIARLGLGVVIIPVLLPGPSALATAPKHNAAAVPVETTICDVARRPNKYDHKLVRLSAVVESDGIEHTVLIDKSCPTSGIEPSFPAGVADSPEVRELHRAVFAAGRAGTAGKRVSATFSGVFRSHKGKIPSRTLAIEKVTELQVEVDAGK